MPNCSAVAIEEEKVTLEPPAERHRDHLARLISSHVEKEFAQLVSVGSDPVALEEHSRILKVLARLQYAAKGATISFTRDEAEDAASLLRRLESGCATAVQEVLEDQEYRYQQQRFEENQGQAAAACWVRSRFAEDGIDVGGDGDLVSVEEPASAPLCEPEPASGPPRFSDGLIPILAENSGTVIHMLESHMLVMGFGENSLLEQTLGIGTSNLDLEKFGEVGEKLLTISRVLEAVRAGKYPSDAASRSLLDELIREAERDAAESHSHSEDQLLDDARLVRLRTVRGLVERFGGNGSTAESREAER